MKLRPTIGNKRIVEIVKAGIDGMLAHEELAVKHNISIYNLKYLLRKMVDMGIIEITRVRDSNGTLGGSYVSVLVVPELSEKKNE